MRLLLRVVVVVRVLVLLVVVRVLQNLLEDEDVLMVMNEYEDSLSES